jgi:hypothetical protein
MPTGFYVLGAVVIGALVLVIAVSARKAHAQENERARRASLPPSQDCGRAGGGRQDGVRARWPTVVSAHRR